LGQGVELLEAKMLSILETLKGLEAYLKKAGLERPKVDAEWLMAETIGCKRLELFLQWERPIDEGARARLRELVRRRAAREPLQYVLGHQDFHDIRVEVGPGVLIPRPETEELVEHVIHLVQDVPAPRIVDLGTGSGAIALAIAKALPNARLLAIDQSAEALQRARKNADLNGLRERVSFRKGNWLEGLALEADCLVSNPPYLTQAEWEMAAPEVRDFEPKEALVADENGFADLRRILKAAPACLANGAYIALESGVGHGPLLLQMANEIGLSDASIIKDASGRNRFFIARNSCLS
jgi:release factor glutamine methyltransferase